MDKWLNRCAIGDCRDMLRRMADDGVRVQCVVTSPPYWGLRDYGTGVWEGGEKECDHKAPPKGGTGPASEVQLRVKRKDFDSGGQYTDTCSKCGAWRVDKQLGLESAPDEYIANMVEVFRLVRQILSDDGVIFVNLGDSYIQDKSSVVIYNVREDLSLEELKHVYLGMFGLRLEGDQSQGQRDVQSVLSTEEESGFIRKGSSMACEGVQDTLCKGEGHGSSSRQGMQPTLEVDGDRQSGREVHLLRGGDKGVPDNRSCEWERGRAPQVGWKAQEQEFDSSLPGHSQTGISADGVSCSLLQLQLRARLLGLLSARSFSQQDIPAHLRGAFKRKTALKPKDIAGIPWRVAFALQADGWYLRSDIIWNKPNPMPESCTDRPTKAHEYLFLLTKGPRYYYDSEAAKEPAASDHPAGNKRHKYQDSVGFIPGGGKMGIAGGLTKLAGVEWETRNRRTVWTIASEPFADAHFATFPKKLVEPCILAGTSERGHCPECGARWERVVDKGELVRDDGGSAKLVDPVKRDASLSAWSRPGGKVETVVPNAHRERIDRGFHPSCTHDLEPVPDIVLDPFLGSGTVAEVAQHLGRTWIGIDLNPAYTPMQERRTAQGALAL